MTFNMNLWIMNARGCGVLLLFWLGGQAGKGGRWLCSCLSEASP